ncbi:MAG: LON peptidase substrate-binding domain-containing protein, partial [Chitinophagaceae bacterium]|nr:LON peptidase substrate-binding domain-containing protein [Chitinophagaceae bacterium]
PLPITVFPGEELNLHIFEERYKQLILDIAKSKKSFGIPVIIDKKISEWGTEIEIIEIEKTHENGELDIRTKAQQVFRILEEINEIPDKLYQGAIINFPENKIDVLPSKMKILLKHVAVFHETIDVMKKYKKPEAEMQSYDVAHHVGLSLEEEVFFLQLQNETLRIDYLLTHLTKAIPKIDELNKLRDRIKLNGHFRKISSED